MNMAVGRRPGLYPEVLWWTTSLIRTGAAPPGPARGTTSACETESEQATEKAYS